MSTIAAAEKTTIPGVEPTYTVTDVRRHLGTNDDTVYRLIRSGELRSVRVGRLYRIPESALAEFIAGGTGRR